MKPDLYTKFVLTIIMLLLAVIACNHYVSPPATASAQGPFAGVQFSGNGFSFFDTRTGDLWTYSDRAGDYKDHYDRWEWEYFGKVTKLGQPLVGGVIDVDGIPKSEKR